MYFILSIQSGLELCNIELRIHKVMSELNGLLESKGESMCVVTIVSEPMTSTGGIWFWVAIAEEGLIQ